MYLSLFLTSTSSATAAEVHKVLLWYEFTTVLTHVASHTKDLPFFHCTKVIPSGRIPSDTRCYGGFSIQDILADIRVLSTMSLRAWYLENRPVQRRQCCAVWPSAFTMVPHERRCGSHIMQRHRQESSSSTQERWRECLALSPARFIILFRNLLVPMSSHAWWERGATGHGSPMLKAVHANTAKT